MKTSLIAALLLACAGAASAQTTVTDAWVRGTVAQQTSSGLFANITSAQGGRLVSVSTPWAGMAEVHAMEMQGNVMRMHGVSGGLELPAGQTVQLKPGGYHVMLMQLKRPLKAGDRVPVTLVVEDAQHRRETIELQVPVRPLGQ